jgi:hypothetical protein
MGALQLPLNLSEEALRDNSQLVFITFAKEHVEEKK